MSEVAKYDSRRDTLLHIYRVRELLNSPIMNLLRRGEEHDASKLDEPEKAIFDEVTPLLKELEYGTPEYQAALDRMGSALDHHYEHNSHHPEHHEHGIQGMSLLDLTEMLIDWKAASERQKNGSIIGSLNYAKERFKLSSEMYAILGNTIAELWPDEVPEE